jgi:exocyst complex component 1
VREDELAPGELASLLFMAAIELFLLAHGSSMDDRSATPVPRVLQDDSNVTATPARREAVTSRTEASPTGLHTEPPTRAQPAQPPSRTSSPANSISSNLPQDSGSGSIRPSSPLTAPQPQVQSPAVLSSLPSSLRPRANRRPSNASQPQIPPLNGLPASLLPARSPLTTPPLRIPKENLPSSASRPSADFVHASSPLSVTAITSELPRSESPVSIRSYQPPSSNLKPTPEATHPRREHNNRVSFFDPANQAALDRLVSEDFAEDGSAGEEETSQATMTNVEEMLEGFEWASDDLFGKRDSKGAADLVGARLLDELIALEKVNQQVIP